MSYQIILGDLGPDLTMQLTFNGVGFVLNAGTDTLVLRYRTPSGIVMEVPLVIDVAATGEVKRTLQAGDLPEVGPYVGQVTLTRTGDVTFPRTFPNNSSKMIWWVHEKI